jgi:site-specific recombinase XerD
VRHFYKYLCDNKINLKKIKRIDAENFCKLLYSKNLVPASRLTTLLYVRKHLHWLKENKKINAGPDDLIRFSDYPKLPKYLPRPIQPEIDQLIQSRLIESSKLYCKGLLLMRWTGLRVGELAKLSRDCVKKDINGNAFLKVPLGKLNTERMVPLSPRILELISTIKTQVDRSIKIKNQIWLLQSPDGKQVKINDLIRTFCKTVIDIQTNEPLTTHRLRHTYATELLTAGMSILALRDILGHKDIRMTLQYAEVTQEKVRKEYFEALNRIEKEQKYGSNIFDNIFLEEKDYHILLRNLALDVKREVKSKKLSMQNFALINKRIKRLQDIIESVLK